MSGRKRSKVTVRARMVKELRSPPKVGKQVPLSSDAIKGKFWEPRARMSNKWIERYHTQGVANWQKKLTQ